MYLMLFIFAAFSPPLDGVYVRDFQSPEYKSAIVVKHERGLYYSVNWLTITKREMELKSGRARYTGLGLLVEYRNSEVSYHYFFFPRGITRVPYCMEIK